MGHTARQVERTYLVLVLGNTLATSLIWGINTLFLLDAGLTNAEAFAANAFFTAGMMLFEIPTGVVADSRGRRVSYLLGTVVLSAATFAYLALWQVGAPFWAWAAVSVLIGLGFTFFSGALEAWVVDALRATGRTGSLEPVFARGQVLGGVGMLTGSVVGGVLAQLTSLGVPYLLRTLVLLALFAVAWFLMTDLGFSPDRSRSTRASVRALLAASVEHGPRRPPVRWLMLSGALLSGVGIYAFYAMQPYLLELYGDQGAYAVAGLAAAVLAATRIAGGLLAPRVRRGLGRRTTVLLGSCGASAILLALLGVVDAFVPAVLLLVAWGVSDAAAEPVRRALLNDLIESPERATVLSVDSLVASAGGVVLQPTLGRVADGWGYGASYLVAGAVQMLALPLLVLTRRTSADADTPDTPGR